MVGKEGGTRGQVSLEYIVLISFILLAIAAALIYVYHDIDTNNRVNTAAATMLDIKQTADRVYAAGPGRKETITIRIPSGVDRTEVGNGAINLVLELPGGIMTEDLEVLDSPRVIGVIPNVDGIHQLSVQYAYAGIVVIGSSIAIEPPLIEMNTTANNRTNATATIINVGDEAIHGIEIGADGQEESWFTLNETTIDLGVGESRRLMVTVETPSGAIPAEYTDFLRANTSSQYCESIVTVRVGGRLCGNQVIEGAEQCEARIPFILPDDNSPACPNDPARCDYALHTYTYSDQNGSCSVDCRCMKDTPTVAVCADPTCTLGNPYCGRCDHCYDGVQNCGETGVDACSRDFFAPVEEMEAADVTVSGECDTGAQISGSHSEGSFSMNLSYVKKNNCREPSFTFNLPERGPGFYDPYRNGTLSFDEYTPTYVTVANLPRFYIRIGNNATRYVEQTIDGRDLFSPTGRWNTVYLRMSDFTQPSGIGAVNWSGSIRFFQIEKKTNSGNGVIEFLIDNIRLWFGIT